MSSFDLVVWKDRAWERLRRSLAQGTSTRSIEMQWVIDVHAISDLDKVVAWCRTRGVSVLFGRKQNGVYDTGTKTIVISASARPLRQVIYLLHECGHHLIGDEDHHGRFNAGYPMASDPAAERSFKHRLACLEEEMEAWHRGWKLAMRLSLATTREQYDEIREECLRTYVGWAAGKKKGDRTR